MRQEVEMGVSLDKRNILVDFYCLDDKRDFLLELVNVGYQVSIVCHDHIQNNPKLHMIIKGSQEYIDACHTASYIFIDHPLEKKDNFLFHKKLFFFAKKHYSFDNYKDIQNTCRLSTYCVFLSREHMIDFHKFYGLQFILKSPAIIFDYIHSHQLFCQMFVNQNFGDYEMTHSHQKDNVLIYISPCKNSHQENLVLNYLNQLSNEKNYFLFTSELSYEFYLKLPDHVQYLVYVKPKYSMKEKILMKLSLYSTFFDRIFYKQTKHFFKRKMTKNLSGYIYDEVIRLLDLTFYASKEIGALCCRKKNIEVLDEYIGVKSQERWYKCNQRYTDEHYDEKEPYYVLCFDEDSKETFYNSSIEFYRQRAYIKKNQDGYNLFLYLRYHSIKSFDISKFSFYFGECQAHAKIKKGLFSYRVCLHLSDEQIENMPTQNKLFIHYQEQGLGFIQSVYYTKHKSRKQKYLKSRIISLNGKTCFYLRQSLKNRVYFTVRACNKTDHFVENLKINLAYMLSYLFKGKEVYLLYEKDSARYEESASVLYEKLIDLGYHQAYFILDKHYAGIDNIEEKYMHNIIFKYSFKHYLYFFISHTFLGSELMIHAMELRCMNKHVLKKVYSTDIHNVFLQHGVMYMISLDSQSRQYFQPKKDGKGKYRVVVSSQKEAQHFIELGGYQPEQMIMSGLPKYDRNLLYDDADNIVIMLTWRVWEYNQAMTDFKSTKYYQMLERIVDGIDEAYYSHLIILPHPLFYKAAQENDFKLKKFMRFQVKYDEILRNTRILITDYSSIAYDAFYRGSRVIFYWEELQECLENYGSQTKLMLNEDNVFGDICYKSEDIKRVLYENYEFKQKDEFVQRYNEIVAFHDGKNTMRLIESLKKEKILK